MRYAMHIAMQFAIFKVQRRAGKIKAGNEQRVHSRLMASRESSKPHSAPCVKPCGIISLGLAEQGRGVPGREFGRGRPDVYANRPQKMMCKAFTHCYTLYTLLSHRRAENQSNVSMCQCVRIMNYCYILHITTCFRGKIRPSSRCWFQKKAFLLPILRF